MNVVSLGAFKKRLERSPHDELYHLFALITLEDGTILTLDKQAQITLKVGNKAYKDSIDVSPPFTTLNEMLDKTKEHMGNDAFFGYNANGNNCQNFLFKFLMTSGKATPEIRAFILQDVKSLFDDNLEYFSKLEEYEKCAELLKYKLNIKRTKRITAQNLDRQDLADLRLLGFQIPDSIKIAVLKKDK
jgi:hypothetical protein